MMNNRDERTTTQEALIRSANIDEASGVLNRGATMRSIEDFLQGEGKSGIHALIMLDVDNLKPINDTLGHQCGDNAIRSVAQTVQGYFRQDDIVGRVGGDEFFAFVKNVSEDTICRKTRDLLNRLQIAITNGKQQLSTSVSAGVSMYYGNAPQLKSLKNLYAEADAALYKAKGSGKNNFSFAQRQDVQPLSPGGVTDNVSTALDLRSLLDNLGVGIVIFHGESPEELIPMFCNEVFLELSGMGYSQFRTFIAKKYNYCVHPDDIEKTRAVFLEAYHGNHSFQHTMRVRMPSQSFHWMSIRGHIHPAAGGGFDVYIVTRNSDQEMQVHAAEVRRYEKYIELTTKEAVNSLSTARLNLTRDRCQSLHREIDPAHSVVLDRTVDEFIDSAAQNVAFPKEREEFLAHFRKAALARSVVDGRYSFNMQMPIRMRDGRIVWCRQSAVMAKNPLTGELECVLRLVDDDILIRISRHFGQTLSMDYEFVADIDAETGFITVLSEKPRSGISPIERGQALHYAKKLRSRISYLVDEEFVEECLRAISPETVLSKLETQSVYTCSYPANSRLLERDGIFQWRFSYTGEDKRTILFTRREMIGFLDKGQRAQPNLNEKSLALGAAAKSGCSKRRQILIADDVAMNREMLKLIFEEDFEIIQARDGEETIRLIDAHHDRLALILLDLKMPKKTGLDVLMHLKLRDLTERIPVIMVTSALSTETNLRSLEYGISDIINKPFDSKIVKRRSLNLIELYAHKEDVEQQLEEWKKEAISLYMRTEKNNELLINTLSSVVEFRSRESGLHINRVRTLTEIMLKTWTVVHPTDHFDRDTIGQIARASTLHDIGKVAIPDNILLKPGKLTDEEFEVMKNHTLLGCEMLEHFKDEDSDFYRYCYDICRYHHERSDGKGYPDGLTGEQIPIWAQIVSIVDVFDALVSPRVYKGPYPPEKAVEMIRNGECGSFSDKLLACFEAAREQILTQSAAMVAND